MILITGATGFLGSQLIKDLLVEGEKIRAIAHLRELICDDVEIDQSKIEWVVGDITDKYFMDEAMQNINQVYHCAGIVSFKNKDKEMLKAVNAEGTAIVVNAALENKIKKFIYVSSVAAMGYGLENEIITEKKSWEFDRRLSPYAISKFMGEQEVWRGINEGLNAIIINPPMIIGTGSKEKGFTKLFEIPAKGIQYYMDGTSGMVDVRDVSRCMIQLMKSDFSGERFIVSAGNISIKEFFTIVAKKFNKPAPSKLLPAWILQIAWRISSFYSFLTRNEGFLSKFEAQSANEYIFYNNEKIRKALSFNFIPLEKSIHAVCEEMIRKKGNTK